MDGYRLPKISLNYKERLY